MHCVLEEANTHLCIFPSAVAKVVLDRQQSSLETIVGAEIPEQAAYESLEDAYDRMSRGTTSNNRRCCE